MNNLKTHPMYSYLLKSKYRLQYPSPCPYKSFGLPNNFIYIQRRTKWNAFDFYRTWAEYEDGFGEPIGNMLLGLKYISHICNASYPCILNVYLKSSSGYRQATYNSFYLGSSADNYRLHVDGYNGDAGDSLAYHNGMEFSTHDNNNDQDASNCAETSRGGWWYNACHEANLNGYHYNEGTIATEDGMTWNSYLGNFYSYQFVAMEIEKQ